MLNWGQSYCSVQENHYLRLNTSSHNCCITSVPAFHLIILPLITFADFAASAAHLRRKMNLSCGVLELEESIEQHWPSTCSRWLHIANWEAFTAAKSRVCFSGRGRVFSINSITQHGECTGWNMNVQEVRPCFRSEDAQRYKLRWFQIKKSVSFTGFRRRYSHRKHCFWRAPNASSVVTSLCHTFLF